MNETEINARFQALTNQRDQANNQNVILFGVVATLEAKVKELEAKLEESNKKDVDVTE